MTGLIARLKWWIGRETKHCRSCCVFCRYFIRCQIYVARERDRMEPEQWT